MRVYGALDITKNVNDPNGVVSPTATFTGSYSCRTATDDPVTGDWSITPAVESARSPCRTRPAGVGCTVTEDAPSQDDGLPDASWDLGASGDRRSGDDRVR